MLRPAQVFVFLMLFASSAWSEELRTVVSSPSEMEADMLDEGRDTSVVTRKDIQTRMPRSAPDALRYEPGVFVQQTAHGQGSAYLRGLTGQQTLLMFDGIRLNNSTFRQGPNQYFFTLDARTLHSIEVQRGGSSTRWGSDALGGALLARPIEPRVSSHPNQGFQLEPRVFLKRTTADSEYGGRGQIELTSRLPNGMGLGFLGGFGARNVGLLRGPPVQNPNVDTPAGPLPWVPRYEEYQPTKPYSEQPELRTQLGTGFKEVTADGRLVLTLPHSQKVTAAAYLYRQYDAPRTDQCPAPTAPFDECLTYEEQFRHLAYVAWEAKPGAMADTLRTTLSWQQQHERRRLNLTSANRISYGVDDVDSFGLTARARRQWKNVPLLVDYGAEHWVDLIRSTAFFSYTDTLQSVSESRGQYLDGSRYHSGGAYADAQWALHPKFTLKGGARVSWVSAQAPGDPQSGSAAVNRQWFPLVGNAGVEWAPQKAWSLFLNADRSFRAPNLDDLTSRQQTGPGFQFENAALQPELAHSLEAGTRLRASWLSADAWLFVTQLDGAMLRVTRTSSECPASTPQCEASWSRLQLVNAPSPAWLRGAEASARLRLPWSLSLRATVSYVFSDGPRVGDLGYGTTGVVPGARVPLSRTPPLNGTTELGWTHPSGLSLGAAMQWADKQDRLALADYADGRIPRYGTPGFAVFHARASWRLDTRLLLSLVMENVFDSPYRFHGSSVNGAGRGLMLQVDAGKLLF